MTRIDRLIINVEGMGLRNKSAVTCLNLTETCARNIKSKID